MEDVETHEKQILKGWKQLEDEKEIIDLKEVQHVCVSGHSLQHTINRLTNHPPSSFCVFVCVCVVTRLRKPSSSAYLTRF